MNTLRFVWPSLSSPPWGLLESRSLLVLGTPSPLLLAARVRSASPLYAGEPQAREDASSASRIEVEPRTSSGCCGCFCRCPGPIPRIPAGPNDQVNSKFCSPTFAHTHCPHAPSFFAARAPTGAARRSYPAGSIPEPPVTPLSHGSREHPPERLFCGPVGRSALQWRAVVRPAIAIRVGYTRRGPAALPVELLVRAGAVGFDELVDLLRVTLEIEVHDRRQPVSSSACEHSAAAGRRCWR